MGERGGGTCQLIKVGKTTLMNDGEEGVVASVLFNTNTIILKVYFLSNKRRHNDDWESKDTRLDS